MKKTEFLRIHIIHLLPYSPELYEHLKLGDKFVQAAQHTTLAAWSGCLTDHAITQLVKIGRLIRTAVAHRIAVTTMQLAYLHR